MLFIEQNQNQNQILEVQRKSQQAKLLDFYAGNQLQDLNADLLKYVSNTLSIKPVALNLVKKIINRLASVYRLPAQRTVKGTEKDIELLKDIELSTMFHAKLKTVSRISKLCQVAFLKVSFRAGKVDLSIISPELVDIETHESPTNITAITITIYSPTNDSSKTTYHRWTAESFEILDHNRKLIRTEANPYKVIPIQVFYNEIPFDLSIPPIDETLISLQETLNLKLTDLSHLILMQAAGIGVAKGITQASQLSISANSIISLPADTNDLKHDFKFLSQEADIQGSIEAIKSFIFWTCMSFGIPASSISDTDQRISGTAREIDNYELQEMRQDNLELYRIFESSLFEIIKAVNNTHNPIKFSDDSTLMVDFQEVKPFLSALEALQVNEKKLELGLTSKINILMESNPDLTRDDAEALLTQFQLDEAN